MVDHRSQGHPASRYEHQARRNDQGPKPSDFIKASGHQRRAEKAGHMTAADQAGPNVKKALPTGPSTYDGFRRNVVAPGPGSTALSLLRKTGIISPVFGKGKEPSPCSIRARAGPAKPDRILVRRRRLRQNASRAFERIRASADREIMLV